MILFTTQSGLHNQDDTGVTLVCFVYLVLTYTIMLLQTILGGFGDFLLLWAWLRMWHHNLSALNFPLTDIQTFDQSGFYFTSQNKM